MRQFMVTLVVALAACGTSTPMGDDESCGDGVCEAGETPTSCPQDCKADKCGDKQCTGKETEESCPEDCARCGDGMCSATEDLASCPQDCAVCGDGTCSSTETASSCPDDCDSTLVVTNISSFTILDLYVYACGTTSIGPNQLGTNEIFTNTSFTLHSIPPGCYELYATGTSSEFWTRSGTQFGPGQTFTWTLEN